MARPVKTVVFVGVCFGMITGGCTAFIGTNGLPCIIGATLFAFGAGMLTEAFS